MLQLDVSDRADLRNMFMHVYFVAATALLFVTFRNYSIQSCKLCSYTQFLDESHFILYHQLSTINKVQMTCDCLVISLSQPHTSSIDFVLSCFIDIDLLLPKQMFCFQRCNQWTGIQFCQTWLNT